MLCVVLLACAALLKTTEGSFAGRHDVKSPKSASDLFRAAVIRQLDDDCDLNELSAKCLDALQQYLDRPADFTFATLCSCYTELYNFLSSCNEPDTALLLTTFCSEDSRNVLCGDVFSDPSFKNDTQSAYANCIQSSGQCSADCKDDLSGIGSDYGCCFDSIWFNRDISDVYWVLVNETLWTNCGLDGDFPGFCKPPPVGAARRAAATGGLVWLGTGVAALISLVLTSAY